MDELFAVLDKLKAAGLVPLAHGGQPWQENIVFTAVLANEGGRDLYLKVLRDRDPAAIKSDAFKKVLASFKRLRSYVDTGAPGRNWNDATAMLITGRAGVQIMGDWAKGEFANANQVAGRDFGCIAGFCAGAPYILQGDVFVFPKNKDPNAARAAGSGGHHRDQAGYAGGVQSSQGIIADPHRCGHLPGSTRARSKGWKS